MEEKKKEQSKMNKKQVVRLWGLNIALYITIIVLTCITGGTLTTSVLGWAIALMLTGLAIYLQFRLIDDEKFIDDLLRLNDILEETIGSDICGIKADTTEPQNQAKTGEK